MNYKPHEVKDIYKDATKGIKKDKDHSFKNIVVDVYKEVKNEHNIKFIEKMAKESKQVESYVQTILDYYDINKLADIPEKDKFYVLCDLETKANMYQDDPEKQTYYEWKQMKRSELKQIIQEVIEEAFVKKTIEVTPKSKKQITNRKGAKNKVVFEYEVDGEKVSKQDFYNKYAKVKDVTKKPTDILTKDADSYTLNNGDYIFKSNNGFAWTSNDSGYTKKIIKVDDLDAAYKKYLEQI
jgi:hypothetical protein